MGGLGQTKGLAAAAELGSRRDDGGRCCCLQTVAGLRSGCVSGGVWWLPALMGLPLNPSPTSSAHPFYLFLYHLSKQTLNLFLQNQLVLEHAVQVKVETVKLRCVSSNRIGRHGVRDPPLPGDRQRPGLQTAAGCPQGEQARLPGPGGQRPPLQGREEAVLQREQAAGQPLVDHGGRAQLATS